MWVARDKSGMLHLFTVKPTRVTNPNSMWRYENTWHINLQYGYEMPIDNNWFAELQWEDEPMKVHLANDNDLSEMIGDILKQSHLSSEEQAEIMAHFITHNYFLDN